MTWGGGVRTQVCSPREPKRPFRKLPHNTHPLGEMSKPCPRDRLWLRPRYEISKGTGGRVCPGRCRLHQAEKGGRWGREAPQGELSEATVVLISVVSSKDCSEAWNLSSIERSMEDNTPLPSPLTLTPPLLHWSHGWPSIPFCVPQHLSVWH